jgi:3-hydroxybutyryl-CoA dehydratase
MPRIEDIKVGDCASCEMLIDEQSIAAFAALSLDDNALHMNQEFAKSCGFPGRVAHGMLSLSTISRLIGTQLPGPGALWISQEFQFVTPVFVNDTISAQVTVQSVSVAARIVTLQTEVQNKTSNTLVLRGTAKVRVPQTVT